MGLKLKNLFKPITAIASPVQKAIKDANFNNPLKGVMGFGASLDKQLLGDYSVSKNWTKGWGLRNYAGTVAGAVAAYFTGGLAGAAIAAAGRTADTVGGQIRAQHQAERENAIAQAQYQVEVNEANQRSLEQRKDSLQKLKRSYTRGTSVSIAGGFGGGNSADDFQTATIKLG